MTPEAPRRVTRRGFLAVFGATAAMAAADRLGAQTPGSTGAGSPPAGSLPGSGPAGSLGDPTAAGRPQPATTARDDDAAIQAIEKRLRCTCGCTLDVYTCRTTDFTCTYSPELHREVVALWDDGKSADEIVAAFVAKYGEEALMAPEPEGFNLAGYLVPGVVVTGLGATLLWVLSRRAKLASTASALSASSSPGPDTHPTITAEDAALLERALAEEDGR